MRLSETAGVGAVFGVVGRCDPDAADRMAAALAHRGNAPRVAPLPAGGFLGVLGPERRTGLATSGRQVAALCGSVYDGAHREAGLDPALPFAVGAAGLWELEADFAAASVDLADGSVRLVRDYFGCEPLYFTRTPRAVAFATEYKALLGLENRFEPDRDMLQHLQHAKRLPPGRTLLEGIESVPPGSIVTIAVSARRSAASAPPLEAAVRVHEPEEAIRLLRGALIEAVELRARDAGTIGVALSGGIDSIALAFLLRALYPDRRIVTVTSGSSPSDPECRTAREVAAAVGSDHHEVVVTDGHLTRPALARLVWHLEDPYSRSEALQLFEVGRVAAKAGCDVILAGTAADALFGGMPRHRLLHAMSRLGPVRNSLEEFFTYTQLGTDPDGLVARLGKWMHFRDGVPPVPRIAGTAYRPADVRLPPGGPEFLNRALAADLQVGGSQDVQKFERGFSAHGVEVRFPFLDRRLVRVAYSITDALKIRRREQKWVFRRACEEWVPERYCRLPKFPQRMASDLGAAVAFDRLLDETGASEGRRASPLFAAGELDRLRRPSTGRPYRYEGAMRIWTAVLSDLWAEAFDAADRT